MTRVRLIRRAAIAGCVVLAAIQFVPVDRDNPPVRFELVAPDSVMAVFRRACYDCHSNETRWPWYNRVAPFSWLVSSHVKKGRGDLNFSDWPVFDFELQDLARKDIYEQVSKGKMPLRSYTVIHREARLDEADRELLIRWAEGGY